MKIISKSKVEFKLGDTAIFPGGHNYPRLNPKDPAVRYQLGILKEEKILEFGEIIEVDPNDLSFAVATKKAAEAKNKDKAEVVAVEKAVARKESLKKLAVRTKAKAAKAKESEAKNANTNVKANDKKAGKDKQK